MSKVTIFENSATIKLVGRIIYYGTRAEILKVPFEERTVSTEKKVVFHISWLFNKNCPFFLLIGNIRKVFCQTLNDKSAGILRFKKLTLLTGNLKKVYKNHLLL